MSLDQNTVLEQIDSVLKKWEEARLHTQSNVCSGLPSHEIAEMITLLCATIERLSPPNSTYLGRTHKILEKYGPTNRCSIADLVGILRALRVDYEAGYLKAIHELIHADVFSDFIDMAEYFISENYKDPAAVMAGSVLEGHLRNLCQKNGINVMTEKDPSKSKKADTMNAELAGENVYVKNEQKQITAWLGIRNDAAHGAYGKYTKEQVNLMIQGIRDFITRHPA